MKKFLVAIALVSISFSGFAQEDAEFKADLREFVELQASGTLESGFAQIYAMVPKENHEALRKEINAKLPELYSMTVDLYIEKLGKEDLKKMLEFYETPAGKRIAEKTPELLSESMLMGQKWGQQTLGPILQKYMGQ